MSIIKNLTDEELENEYIATYQSVNVIESYGVKDIIYLDQLEREIQARGFEIHLTPKIIRQ